MQPDWIIIWIEKSLTQLIEILGLATSCHKHSGVVYTLISSLVTCIEGCGYHVLNDSCYMLYIMLVVQSSSTLYQSTCNFLPFSSCFLFLISHKSNCMLGIAFILHHDCHANSKKKEGTCNNMGEVASWDR